MSAALDLSDTSPPEVAPARSRRSGSTRALTTYGGLSQQVQALGLLGRRRGFYWTRIATGVTAFAACWVGFGLLGNSWLQLLVAAALAVVLHQFAYLGHDGAHRQIFASSRWNEWAGRVFAGLFGGLSYGWWMSKHNRHHGAPNQLGKDTDIESEVFAFHPEAAGRLRGVREWLGRRQGWAFFPLLPFEGINLHIASYQRLLSREPIRRRWVDLGFMTVRLTAYVAVLFVVLSPGRAAAFLGVQLGVFGLLMGLSFAPNHTGMPIVGRTEKLDFLRRQVLTSRNISGGWAVDLFMGGLNHQVEHHLFPSMPRPNLRHARPLVKAFCAEHGIRYTETTLVESFAQIVRYLNAVGVRAADPFSCPLKAQLRSS